MGLAAALLCLSLTESVHALPFDLLSAITSSNIFGLSGSVLDTTSGSSVVPYSVPGQPDIFNSRADGIATKRSTFLYGLGVDLGGPSSPTGPLGLTYVASDSAIVNSEEAAQQILARSDQAVATVDSGQYDGLTTVEDYTKLYDGQWQASAAPTGVDPGMLTNYTQDLLFSMERLSVNPYAVRRLNPAVEELPFDVDDATVSDVTSQSLQELFSEGRLFYADHRAQDKLPRTTDKYAPACDAYFYIDSRSGGFLPLAIRTNVGSNLIYTPNDSPNDWLLAKMMYNANDFLFGQSNHLANTHYVSEVAWQAAIRTLSDNHPVLGVLGRLMYGAFGIRPLALEVLFLPGLVIDQYFGYTGLGTKQYVDNLYYSGYAGAFQGNYFLTNLQRRGLIDSTIGPELTNFPFYEDGLPIYNAIRTFMSTLVGSYYSSDAGILADTELQAWVAEATGPAQAIDFPSSLSTTDQLIDLLTHMAHLVSIAHHTVNTNQLISGSGILPLNPTALYQPIPTSKGVTNVASYLPPLNQCLGFIGVAANFARPLLAGTSRSLIHMFDDATMLSRMTPAVSTANQAFISTMQGQSNVVKSRTFDEKGLSQGMPFVWKTLDPDVAPWSLTV